MSNINNIFKQAFDSFEADVNPKVWNNVQNAVKANVSGTTSTSVSTGVATNTVLLKLVAGLVLATATVATAIYFTNNNTTTNKKIVTTPLINQKTPNTKHQTLNTKHQTPNTKVQTPKPKHQTPNTKAQTPKPKHQTPNTKHQTPKPKHQTPKPKAQTLNTKHQTPNTKAQTPNTKNQTPINKIAAKIIASSLSGKAPLDVDFNVENDNNIVSYLWDFDDNSPTSNEEAPFHTFVKSGIYKVTLTVIDKNANSKTLIQFIEVQKDVTSSLAKIPNIFTPNGDGQNDVYKIQGENIKVFNARILNTNGKTIYEWNTINGGWNGKDAAGNILPNGSYIIRGLAIGEDGEQYPIKSIITLKK